jgi:1-acyl-sn-glycerol-3-phosphate acyltransferase
MHWRPKARRDVVVARRFFKLFRFLLLRVRLRGACNLRSRGPLILVANHEGSFGPLSLLTSLPLELYPWVVDETTDARTAARRIQAEFLEAELHLRPPLSAWLARAIARIAAALMRDINAVPVHQKSRRVRETVARSLEILERGGNILVFPEDPVRRLNGVLNDFCTGFLHLARLYYVRTSKAVLFLPVAVNRKVRSILVGQPVRFDASAPFIVEKARLKKELEHRVEELYRSLEDDKRLTAGRA